MKRLSFMLALLCAYAVPALAQIQGGSITGVIRDEQGGVLPGVTVSVQGVDATQTAVTEATGEYRFLNLAPGPYKVTATLPGFTTIIREAVGVGGQKRRAPDDVEDRAGRRNDHGERRVAGDRYESDRDVHQLHCRRADEDPHSRDPFALMRSVPECWWIA